MRILNSFNIVAIALLLLISSCSVEEQEGGQGLLQLSFGIDSQTPQVETKAAATDICKVQIANGNGDIIKKYDDPKDMPADLWLVAGQYTVSATYGTPKRAEFDHPCYAGSKTIEVVANKSIRQEITCRLVQSKVSVRVSEAVKKNFKDYPVVVSMGTDKLTFAKGATSMGYFLGNKGDEDLLCEITATANNDSKIAKKYTIDDIQPHTHYIINLDYKSNYEDGGLKFEISLEEEPDAIDDEMNVSLKKYPVLSYNSAQPSYTFLKEDEIKEAAITIEVEGYPLLNELVVGGSYFTDVLMKDNPVNLLRLTPEELKGFEAVGVVFVGITPEEKHEKTTLSFNIDVSKVYSKKEIQIKAKDSYGKERTINLDVTISPSQVRTNQIKEGDVWATFATLTGERLNENASLSFQYRAEDELIWKNTETVPAGEKQIKIKDLKPGTQYVYRATDGASPSVEYVFTTEEDLQVPNMDFDDWIQEGKAWYPNLDLSAANYWWDTANGGTSILSINPTTPESGDVHTKGSGKKAAKLSSTIAAGKFAAGNLYTGKFNGLVGFSGASLYFGRPYTNRPTQMKGWFKYNPGTVTHNPEGKLTGDKDIASIFIALCTWEKPHHMNTTDPETFIDTSKNNPTIIAYGEVPEDRLNKNMAGYEEFVIDIKYRDLSKKTTYILIVASSSKYGDYFSGSTDSALLLDDFELVFGDPMEDK